MKLLMIFFKDDLDALEFSQITFAASEAITLGEKTP